MTKLAFIFLGTGIDSTTCWSELAAPKFTLVTIGVSSYEAAAMVARDLYDDGCSAIELCAGFGHKGVAMVVDAVEGKIPVGVVRFDNHPNINNKSGDTVFL